MARVEPERCNCLSIVDNSSSCSKWELPTCPVAECHLLAGFANAHDDSGMSILRNM
jgi:hypothetical protein